MKSDAEDELLVAVDAVLQGNQFISRRLRSDLTDRVEEGRSTNIGLRSSEGQTPWREADHFHEMGCYRDDAAFVGDFIRFIEAALNIGKVVILVATESHRKGIFSGLQSHGWDMVAAMREGTYVSQDSYEMLSSFLVEDWPDADRLRMAGDKLIEKATKGRKAAKIVICGECAPLLWAQGKTEAAVEIERLWDELVVRRHGIDLLCGYVTSDFPGEASNPEFKRICAEHSAVYSL